MPEAVAHRLRADLELGLVQRIRIALRLNEVVPVEGILYVRGDVISTVEDSVRDEGLACFRTREALSGRSNSRQSAA